MFLQSSGQVHSPTRPPSPTPRHSSLPLPTQKPLLLLLLRNAQGLFLRMASFEAIQTVDSGCHKKRLNLRSFCRRQQTLRQGIEVFFLSSWNMAEKRKLRLRSQATYHASRGVTSVCLPSHQLLPIQFPISILRRKGAGCVHTAHRDGILQESAHGGSLPKAAMTLVIL